MKKKIIILVAILLLLCTLFGIYIYTTKDWVRPENGDYYPTQVEEMSGYFKENPSLSLEDWAVYIKQAAEQFKYEYNDTAVEVEQNKAEYHETIYSEKDGTVQSEIDIVLCDRSSLAVNTDATTFEDAVTVKNLKRVARNKYGIKMPFVYFDAKSGKGDGFRYYNTPMMREKDENGQYTNNYQFYMVVEFEKYIARIVIATDDPTVNTVLDVYTKFGIILDRNGILFYNQNQVI